MAVKPDGIANADEDKFDEDEQEDVDNRCAPTRQEPSRDHNGSINVASPDVPTPFSGKCASKEKRGFGERSPTGMWPTHETYSSLCCVRPCP